MNEARDHHYVPQFLLRNFATDPQKQKATTVAKNGEFAIWAERSIEGLGFERDLYVHMQRGTPVSVENQINHHIETPISRSDTWAKITSGQTAALDRSDKAILYALIRHLEARTPHYHATHLELAQLAALPTSAIAFSDEERVRYAEMLSHPELTKRFFNYMASSLEWTEQNFRGAGLTIMRSKVRLRSSSTPVMAISALPHPKLWLPLPGMTPFQCILTLTPHTMASLVLGDFDDAFLNIEVEPDVARGINRYFVGQFGHNAHTRHLITGRDGLAEEMAWAHFDTLEDSPRKLVFHRKARA